MKTRVAAVVVGLMLAAGLGAWVGAQGLSDDPKSAFGIKGLVEVRELVITYEAHEPTIVKAHLASGITVENTVTRPEEVERLFQISQAFAQPRARLAVRIEKNDITAYHLATGVGAEKR